LGGAAGAGVENLPGTPLSTQERSFRIPDVLALAPGQRVREEYLRDTPYIVVEILSPDDRASEMNEKIRDYLDNGVPNIWVVDPPAQTLTVHEPGKSRIVSDRVETSDGAISVDVAGLFRQLAEDEA
jgi:Uma2 family endonuclease